MQDGDRGGGADGGADGGGEEGGAEGSRQEPSQSTMYVAYTKLPSYGFSSTNAVATVSKLYVLSRLGGSSIILAHSKKPRPSTGAPSKGLHLPCTSSPLAYVPTMNSPASSKSVSLTDTVR